MAHRHVVPGIHLPAQYRINDPGSLHQSRDLPASGTRPPSPAVSCPDPSSPDELPYEGMAQRPADRGLHRHPGPRVAPNQAGARRSLGRVFWARASVPAASRDGIAVSIGARPATAARRWVAGPARSSHRGLFSGGLSLAAWHRDGGGWSDDGLRGGGVLGLGFSCLGAKITI
jgi:hypothetical protein